MMLLTQSMFIHANPFRLTCRILVPHLSSIKKQSLRMTSTNPEKSIKRCAWVTNASPNEILYHDTEWCRLPIDSKHHSDSYLFELLTLEGAQAGLSWSTVLSKRENYRKLYHSFDLDKILLMNEDAFIDIQGVIRHKGKLMSVLGNAKVVKEIQHEFGSFSEYIWSFFKIPYTPIVTRFNDLKQYPTTSNESILLSKDLKKRGAKFVGPTIMYAFLQATGFVDDHQIDCFLAQSNTDHDVKRESKKRKV
uniref:DNA-3-methyladenine glycosylase I n=1 Tax=Timspurckia oligopyrenoides TaxID=708627 RepID=A0A7S1ERT7_9RHOD|mmetsp:Transcript_3000/g.5300  ORF Transcript_3000/g.5300 Transcript_3000/m.5300 type:complete len:249 (+) Transcript_3000:82-828(+)